jgi:hypothetical protein
MQLLKKKAADFDNLQSKFGGMSPDAMQRELEKLKQKAN